MPPVSSFSPPLVLLPPRSALARLSPKCLEGCCNDIALRVVAAGGCCTDVATLLDHCKTSTSSGADVAGGDADDDDVGDDGDDGAYDADDY
eukprot:43745-Pyramimonas_sp.AAC.1